MFVQRAFRRLSMSPSPVLILLPLFSLAAHSMLSQEYKPATTGMQPWEILHPSPLPSNLVPITEQLRNCCYSWLQSVGILLDVSKWPGPMVDHLLGRRRGLIKPYGQFAWSYGKYVAPSWVAQLYIHSWSWMPLYLYQHHNHLDTSPGAVRTEPGYNYHNLNDIDKDTHICVQCDSFAINQRSWFYGLFSLRLSLNMKSFV